MALAWRLGVAARTPRRQPPGRRRYSAMLWWGQPRLFPHEQC